MARKRVTMILSIVIMLLGLYCLLLAPRYYPMIGYRGALYYMKKQGSWKITNQIFGLYLFVSGLVYFINGNLKLLIILVIISIMTTDLISMLILKRKQKNR